jgi:hypothetical protein
VTSGAATSLISSADNGVSWQPFRLPPPYKPTGVAHVAGGTVIWTSNCAAGTQAPEQAILRLADS